MSTPEVMHAERRTSTRRAPEGPIAVRRVRPVLPLSDATVLNVSSGGVALRTQVPLKEGERLSFHPGGLEAPAVTAEVLAVETLAQGQFRVRCRCVLGGFE